MNRCEHYGRGHHAKKESKRETLLNNKSRDQKDELTATHRPA